MSFSTLTFGAAPTTNSITVTDGSIVAEIYGQDSVAEAYATANAAIDDGTNTGAEVAAYTDGYTLASALVFPSVVAGSAYPGSGSSVGACISGTVGSDSRATCYYATADSADPPAWTMSSYYGLTSEVTGTGSSMTETTSFTNVYGYFNTW
jgi:hypothetical protein